MDGAILALIGELIAYSGDWERGCNMVERAAQLNPRHPGWYWLSLCYNAHRKCDYRATRRLVLRTNLPDFFDTHVMTAAAHAQLGEVDAAGRPLTELLRLRPDIAAVASEEFEKRWDSEFVEQLVSGLRKAGLEVS